MSLSEVTDFYSINYPELTTATLHGPELEEDRAVYRFKTTIGIRKSLRFLPAAAFFSFCCRFPG